MNAVDGQNEKVQNEKVGTLWSSVTFRLLPFALYALPCAFLAFFFLLPLGAIFGYAGGGGLFVIAGDPYYLRVIWFSAWLGAVSTLLTLTVALPGAYVFARLRFPGKTALRALATVPFVLPTVVVAAAFGELLGPHGLLNRLLQAMFGLAQPPIQLDRTLALVLLAHVFYNYSIVLRIVGGFWQNVDVRFEQAAAVLGANRLRVFRTVTLPLLAPAIGAAALLVFIFCFGSFGIVLILGGPEMSTVEVEIYRQTAQLLRLDIAAALALVQMLITLAATLAYTRLQQRAAVRLGTRGREANLTAPHTRFSNLALGLNLIFTLLLIGGPLLALALRSVTASDGSATLDFYQRLATNTPNALFFVPPLIALGNSLLFASATVILALATGVPGAYLVLRQKTNGRRQTANLLAVRLSPGLVRPLANVLFTLPLGTSAVTLGLGFLLVFGGWGWLQSPLLLPVAHTLLAFPLVVRGLVPALRAIDTHLREVSQTLGAPPMRVVRTIDLPLLAPALISGAIYAFTISLGDFGAALLLNQAAYPTVPLIIFRLLARPGAVYYGQAMALCTLLLLATIACFLLLERLQPVEQGM